MADRSFVRSTNAGPSGPGYLATSTSSLSIGTGSKTFVTQSGLAYAAGTPIQAFSTGSSAYMQGTVTSYSGTSLVANMTITSGSGSHSDWNLSVIGSASTVSVGTTTTGSPGSSASVSNSGTVYAAVLNFTVPAGATGSPGTGLNFRGAWVGGVSAVTYAQGDTVTYSGALYASLINGNNNNIPSSTPSDWQDLGSSASAAGSTGDIQFNTSGAFSADTGKFFWDSTNHRLGVGTGSPGDPIEIAAASGSAPSLSLNQTSVKNWHLRNNATSGNFVLNDGTSDLFTLVSPSGNLGLGVSSPSYTLDASGGIHSATGFYFPDSSLQNSSAGVGPMNWSQTPGGSLSTGNQTITLSPLPSGITSALNGKGFLRISGGTGVAETVPIVTVSGSNVTVTCANTHSGAWAIASASAGIQEAVIYAGPGGIVRLAGTSYAVYGTIYCPYPVYIRGAGKRSTTLLAQAAGTAILDFDSNYCSASDFYLNVSAQGTSTNYGIRIGNSGEASFCTFQNLMFNQTYAAIYGVNASNWKVLNCTFYNFTAYGIFAQDIANPDYDGPTILGCDFYNYSLSSPATAAIYVASSGSITVIGCPTIQGASTNQLNYGIYVASAVSTGLTIQGNYFQNIINAAIVIAAGWENISITGNHYVQNSAFSSGGGFILISTSAGNNSLWGTITGNDVAGPNTSGGFFFLQLTGVGSTFIANFVVGNNVVNNVTYYLVVQTGPSVQNFTFNSESISSCSTFVAGSGSVSNIIFNRTFEPTFANLPACAVGSVLYCTDSNSTGSAGSSTGRTLFRENSSSPTWTH